MFLKAPPRFGPCRSICGLTIENRRLNSRDGLGTAVSAGTCAFPTPKSARILRVPHEAAGCSPLSLDQDRLLLPFGISQVA
jgi:hypothetical protein